jgi:hypothetical protein
METTHQLEAWRDLYVMLGTSSAALLGLLYVVTSLHLDEIVNNAVYRTRARSNSLYLIVTLVEAALFLTPQPMVTLGLTIIVVNVFGLSVNVRNTYRILYKNWSIGQHGGMTLYRAFSFMFGFLLGIAGGAGLFAGSSWGLYLVTASYLVLLVGVALNAWSIMLGVGQTEEAEKTNRRATRKARS